jgi:DNA polymerase
LDNLRTALEGFEHCEPKKGARNFIFGEGNPAARVLVLVEAPHREEDVSGMLMTGPQGPLAEGILFDKMLQAIDLSRSSDDAARSLYLAPILPWRTVGDREVTAQELAMMQPFLARHVEFIDPEIILLIGNAPCAAALGQPGVTRLRGQWKQAFGKPARALIAPRALMAQPALKRDAWNDLLEIRARLGH